MEAKTNTQHVLSIICDSPTFKFQVKVPNYPSSHDENQDITDETEFVRCTSETRTCSKPFSSVVQDGFSALLLDDDSITKQPKEDFNPLVCLFCAKNSSSFDQSLEHTHQKHGLFIPAVGLQVDFKTLVKYLHLVIYGYFECIFCGSQRNSVQAVQQHVTGKGHCKIDLEKEDSEFRDFYDFESIPMLHTLKIQRIRARNTK
jgi:hypothetical protein